MNACSRAGVFSLKAAQISQPQKKKKKCKTLVIYDLQTHTHSHTHTVITASHIDYNIDFHLTVGFVN